MYRGTNWSHLNCLLEVYVVRLLSLFVVSNENLTKYVESQKSENLLVLFVSDFMMAVANAPVQ